MPPTIINDVSLGLGVVPITTRFGNLREFEKGRIHYLDELFARTKLLYFTRNFFNSAFCKNNQKPFSFKTTLTVLTIPSMLTLVKSSYASHYVNPKVVSAAVRIEKYIGKLCYIGAFINAVALVSFGHLAVGYTALAVFGLDMATSFTPILKRFPQMCKVRIVFIHYISPFATLINGLAIKSYTTIVVSILAIYSLLKVQRKADKKIKKSRPLKYSEFISFLNDLQSENIMLLEMNRERTPLIKIPVLDSAKYNPDKLLEFFDAINWNDREIQELLQKRVSDIPQVGKKDWLQAKKIAKIWLKNVLNTPEPELLLFKQHICKMLLENEDLLKSKIQTEQSRNLFKGLLTFIFGSGGGECRIAQSMKIKQGFLEICKSCNKTDEVQNNLILLLELQYKNITEQAFRDTFNPILQYTLDFLSFLVVLDLRVKTISFTRDWEMQRFAQMPKLIITTFNYLQEKYWTWLIEEFRKQTDLNSVHNFSRVAKLFGEVFNITSDVDEVAEKNFSKLLMNPLSPKTLALINKASALTIGKFYWNTQLEKIIPLLKYYFKNNTLKFNDLLSWFHNLLESFKSLEKLDRQALEKIDAIQEELQKEQPTISGLSIIEKYECIENERVPIPSDKALILFAYCINLLRTIDPESHLNRIDQNLKTYKWGINVESEVQPILQLIEALSNFLPRNMQSYVEEHLESIEEIGDLLNNCQMFMEQYINKDALFFAG